MRNSFKMAWVVILILVFIIGVLAYILGRNSKNVTVENIATNTHIIKQISELATLEVMGTASIKSTNVQNDGSFTDNVRKMFMENTIDISVPYIGKYGVNLEKQQLKIQEENKRIAIYLPRPTLLSYEIVLNKVSSSSNFGWLQPENNQRFSQVEQKLYEQSRNQLENNTSYVAQSKKKIAEILQSYYEPTGYVLDVYFGDERYSMQTKTKE